MDIVVAGWRAFWANILNWTSGSILLAVLIAFTLIGVAVKKTSSMLMVALRVMAGVLGVMLILGFLGVLGVRLDGSGSWVHTLLNLVQFPIYQPEA